MKSWKSGGGFTIVELLIVVVVIAILAAITIVSFNGIQRQSYNSAMLTTAKQSYTALLQHISRTGAYPLTAVDTEMCLTTDNVCVSNLEQSIATNNAGLITALSVNGGLPKSAPDASARRGVVYYRYPSRSFNGVTDAAYVYFVLRGENQKCSIGQVANDARVDTAVVASTTGYSWVGGGFTGCYIYVPR